MLDFALGESLMVNLYPSVTTPYSVRSYMVVLLVVTMRVSLVVTSVNDIVVTL